MRTRFEWGLITDVQAPDLETRIAILRKKAQSERLQVHNEILEYMASKVSSNIRELEGTLIRVSAFASLNRTPVDMSLAQTVLKDLITLDEDNVISPADIINHTAEYFKLTVDDLYGSSRSQAVATARQIAMYLCRELTNLSLPKIGQLFGNRDHTTVMYAYKKISELMKERRSIYNQVTEISRSSHQAGPPLQVLTPERGHCASVNLTSPSRDDREFSHLWKTLWITVVTRRDGCERFDRLVETDAASAATRRSSATGLATAVPHLTPL